MGKDRTLEIIKTEIESLKSIEYPCDNSQQATGFFNALDRMTDFLSTLESEKPINKDCNDCPHCVDRKDQYGWHFKGCFGGPYKGKFIAEIDECPLKKEQPEVDSEKPMQEGLEEAVVDYFEGYWPGMETAEQCNTDLRFTPPAIMRLARHFAQWGAEHLKK